MIAYLDGILLSRYDPYILINVHGVGYKVYASYTILQKLPSVGSPLHVYIHTNVKEDAIELYGFSNIEELSLFEMLIGISGIGPKTASGVFSIGKVGQILQAIRDGDVNFFTKVPRMGKKNAQKIIIELRSKLDNRDALDLSEHVDGATDVVRALTNFGFSHEEVLAALKKIDANLSDEEKIRSAFKLLGK